MKERKKRRQDAWNERNGLVTRSDKLQKEIADKFKDTCEKIGISQKKQLETMMKEFIEKN